MIERRTDEQTHRRTDAQTHRRTDAQTHRRTDQMRPVFQSALIGAETEAEIYILKLSLNVYIRITTSMARVNGLEFLVVGTHKKVEKDANLEKEKKRRRKRNLGRFLLAG